MISDFKLAAKAAGYKVEGEVDRLVAQPGHYAGGLSIYNDCGGSSLWNPVTDDGDALRLAGRLGAEVKTFCMPVYLEDKPYVTVRISFWNGDQPSIIERRAEYTKDQMQAVRTTIFDVAVELGTRMTNGTDGQHCWALAGTTAVG